MEYGTVSKKQKTIQLENCKRRVNKEKKILIVIGHPDTKSFCYNGIFKTIVDEVDKKSEDFKIIDLYRDSFRRPRTDLIESYKKMVTWSTHIYFISPVWWFRLTPRMEIFFDEVLTPGFAYNFKNITKLYAYPQPHLSDKKVRTYITHGAPMLPVVTLYLNSVKLRLVLGVFTFVFGWKISRWLKTKQFWSVPFVSDKKRKKYLEVVKKDMKKDLR